MGTYAQDQQVAEALEKMAESLSRIADAFLQFARQVNTNSKDGMHALYAQPARPAFTDPEKD